MPQQSPRAVPRHSVSGFSSGASLAINHLLAFSSSVVGAGVLAGSPYGCASLPDAANVCSGMGHSGALPNASIPWATYVTRCVAYANSRSAQGTIDPLSSLAGKPVFLFSGTLDTIVFQPVMHAVMQQLTRLNASVRAKFDIPAEHSWVVDSQTCAHPGARAPSECCGLKDASTTCPPPSQLMPSASGCCGECAAGGPGSPWWKPPINSCEYDLSGEMLRFILEGPDRPSGPAMPLSRAQPVPANLRSVNQSALLAAGWSAASAFVDEQGFVYLPTRCEANLRSCAVHVHYHACGAGWRFLSSSYMLETGLAAYAEGSGIVLVYPQASQSGPSGAGCWDWYGATGADVFDTRDGVQLRLALRMVESLPELTRIAIGKAARRL